MLPSTFRYPYKVKVDSLIHHIDDEWCDEFQCWGYIEVDDEAYNWCLVETEANWSWDHEAFWFESARDAMRFKLAFSGK